MAGFPTVTAAVGNFRWQYPTYAAHENGSRSLEREAAKYAKAYRVDEAWLLTGQGKGPSGEVRRQSDGSEALLAIYDSLPEEFRARLLDDARILRAAADMLAPDQLEPRSLRALGTKG
jgi:hypothetical protein